MMDKSHSEGRRKFLKWAVAGTITLAGIDVLSKEKKVILKYLEDFKESFKDASSKPKEGISPVSDYRGEGSENRAEFDGPKHLPEREKKMNENTKDSSTGYNQATSSNYSEPQKAPTEQIELKSAPKKNLEGMAGEGLKKKSVGQTRASSGTYDRFGSNDMAKDLQAHSKNYGKKPKGTDTNVYNENPKSLVSEGKRKENDLELKAIEDLKKSEFELDGLYKIFDKDGNETGMYLEKELYNGITKEKLPGESVQVFWIPGDFYVKSGQGWFSRTGNQIATRGTFVPVYSNKYGRLDGVYTTQSRANKACGNNYDQSFKSFLEGCAGENCLRTPCVKFHEESVIFNPESLGGGGGGSDGGAGGVGGSSGGGGQGGGGGGSAGAR